MRRSRSASLVSPGFSGSLNRAATYSVDVSPNRNMTVTYRLVAECSMLMTGSSIMLRPSGRSPRPAHQHRCREGRGCGREIPHQEDEMSMTFTSETGGLADIRQLA